MTILVNLSHLLLNIILDYFEGDILLTPEQQRFMEATANPSHFNAPQNAVVRHQQSLWQGGVVPYVLDGLNSKKYIIILLSPALSLLNYRFISDLPLYL